MTDGANERLGVFIGLGKALIWPCTVIFLVFALCADISSLLTRVSKLNVGGATLELVEAVSQIDKQIAKSAPAGTDSLKDVPVSRDVKALTDLKQALIASAGTTNTGSITRIGWAYVGASSGGKWLSRPTLALSDGQEPKEGDSYRVTTDTYLREHPPSGTNRVKGDVITVIPEDTRPRILAVQRDTDPNSPGRTLIWARVEYATKGTQ